MNRAILDNPFDDELTLITSPFGALLRSIVSTVDQHGLKKRYLARHARSVEAFFNTLQDRVFESEAAIGLRDRLIKNRNRLFRFIHRDGVAWNNNIAENAIKRVAYFREDAGKSIKEVGINEHIVLLSLYQTCRLRDISFLKFLLSKQRDIDAYYDDKRIRRRRSQIEVYPIGYLPPAIASIRRDRRSKLYENSCAGSSLNQGKEIIANSE
jgi:hypothetical protein